MPQLDPSTYVSQFFWLIVSFLSLWLIMAWFIIPKIDDIIKQRRQKIDAFIQKAEKINAQALSSLDKYHKALDKAKNSAETAIAQNRQDLDKTIAEKKAEIEDALAKKIADSEYVLAKQKQETLDAIEHISQQLADNIIQKLNVEKSNSSKNTDTSDVK